MNRASDSQRPSSPPRRWRATAALACCLVVAPVWAADTPTSSVPDIQREMREARALIKKEDWAGAIKQLEQARGKDNANADVYNLLGFASRKSGNLDRAFENYDKALKLNPKHLGAHEYIGEAYLMAKQPDKAREHLDKLKSLCGTCEEYQDLAKAVANYKP